MKVKQIRWLNITLSAVFITALVLFMLTFSIGLPIYCRFLYYIQINTLNLPEKTGWSYAEIKQAYDNCLNFCTLPNVEFSTYPLKWTENEAAHFADCKVLFNLNFWVLLSSGIITLALTVLNRLKVITLYRPFGHRAYLMSAVIAIALPVIIIFLVLIVGFDKAFTVFHSIFFPGKTNWVFYPETEQIIQVMPEQFFMNCAIVIACGLIAFSVALITADLIIFHRERRAAISGDI